MEADKRYIAPAYLPIKPIDALPSIDKVAIWLMRRIDFATFKKFKQQYGNYCHIGKHPAPFPGGYLQRLEFKQPTDDTLRWIASQKNVLINSVEITLDYIFQTMDETDAAYYFLDRCLCRRWHRATQRVRGRDDESMTRYDASQAANNNLVLYLKTSTKLRLEWRLKGKRAVRAAGIFKGQDLVDFSHFRFWQPRLLLRRVKLEEKDVGRLADNLAKNRKRQLYEPDDDRRGHIICSLPSQMIVNHFTKFWPFILEDLSVEDWLPSPCSIPSYIPSHDP